MQARHWLVFLIGLNAAVVQADQRPVLSLVIDDLGYSLDYGKAAIDLSGDHTYAILPSASYSKQLARHARAQNKEVILHLPMQSIGSQAPPEPDALNEAMDEDQLSAKVHSLLSKIPFIKGINNHMGSHLTEFDFFMQPVMQSIRDYNPELYFLDSRTTPRSVAHTQALDAGLSSASRDIFLDNDHSNPESIYLQFQMWLALAMERGSAIAIGHPHPSTVEVLREHLPQASAKFRFVPISVLIQERNNPVFTSHWQKTLTNLDENLN